MPKLFNDRNFYTDFVLPGMVILGCIILLITGRNGEVKGILAVAAGWVFRTMAEARKRS